MMSTFQQTQTSSLSPILLSPSSTTITNHASVFDNSDQGSVDSDYTSLGSSKFYGNSGSTSSLHHQGRSQSIDELASTTTIPTRHFNGTSNANKSSADPLQFVKIHPNHDLIDRAQEQLSLAEARTRLQETYKLTNNSKDNQVHDDDNYWTKAVENWRQKRTQKRLKSTDSIEKEEDRPPSPIKIVHTPKPEETKKPVNEPLTKPTLSIPSPPIEQIKSKSPSPLRNKGPARIRELYIEKPVDIRGFGFKLDDGRSYNRAIFISAIEEGSPADKVGLCIDDEVIVMNDENIEKMPFDHVRRILKERNLRGSIKMLVRTYEDIFDDNSQTVTGGFTTDHSRTPSPQKAISSATVPSIPMTTTKPNPIPVNIQSTTSQTTRNLPVQRTSSTPMNILAPKPYRSTPSINTLDNQDSELTFSRKELLTLMSIYDKELQDLEAEFEKQLRGIDEIQRRESTNEKEQMNLSKSPPRVAVNTPQSVPSPPVASTTTDSHPKQPNQNDSSIAQVRSYVEKQMDQLQQDLEFGFSRSPKNTSAPVIVAQEQQPTPPVTTPITSPAQQDCLRPSLKKSSSTQNELDQIPSNRTYGIKIDPNEQVLHYLDPYSQQRPMSSHTKRSIPDIPSSLTTINRPSTTHSIERTVNELKINMSGPYSSQPQIINQQQKKVTIQLGGKIPAQRITSKQLHATLNQAPKKAHFEDHAWIHEDQRQPIMGGNHARRTAPLAPHYQDIHISRQTMPNYQDHHPRNGPQRTSNGSPNRQRRSPVRPMLNNTNNDRVLSVSGKLRCSRCNDELGQGSAMVIESLGLYYHIECFRCFVCNIPLSSSLEGIDVRVRNNRLHCQNCFSDDNGVKLSAV